MLTPSLILEYIESTFIKRLVSAIKKEIKVLKEKGYVCIHDRVSELVNHFIMSTIMMAIFVCPASYFGRPS